MGISNLWQIETRKINFFLKTLGNFCQPTKMELKIYLSWLNIGSIWDQLVKKAVLLEAQDNHNASTLLKEFGVQSGWGVGKTNENKLN